MTPETITMDGASWLAPFVRSFATKEQFVKDRMATSPAWLDKPEKVRSAMFGQVYDIACPVEKKKK